MSKMWVPKPKEVLLEWLEALESEDDKLSAWEIDFVESVLSQLRYKPSLSQSQEETLEKIYAGKTS